MFAEVPDGVRQVVAAVLASAGVSADPGPERDAAMWRLTAAAVASAWTLYAAATCTWYRWKLTTLQDQQAKPLHAELRAAQERAAALEHDRAQVSDEARAAQRSLSEMESRLREAYAGRRQMFIAVLRQTSEKGLQRVFWDKLCLHTALRRASRLSEQAARAARAAAESKRRVEEAARRERAAAVAATRAVSAAEVQQTAAGAGWPGASPGFMRFARCIQELSQSEDAARESVAEWELEGRQWIETAVAEPPQRGLAMPVVPPLWSPRHGAQTPRGQGSPNSGLNRSRRTADTFMSSSGSGGEPPGMRLSAPGWGRVVHVHGARLSKDQHVSSDPAPTRLPTDTKILVEDVVGRRARISFPLAGWVSLYTKSGETIVRPETPSDGAAEDEAPLLL
eukprot:TRINITY_DN12064_c0_g1_i4.p1 TRINITY_DN12064_c0_g1~~TRINITY_DN12064_c0_g1_i4.p1  ORF type:complete len:395 (+),score=45.58 TRINITY_DN12064_c0_g1_i4:69-1253(+)